MKGLIFSKEKSVGDVWERFSITYRAGRVTVAHEIEDDNVYPDGQINPAWYGEAFVREQDYLDVLARAQQSHSGLHLGIIYELIDIAENENAFDRGFYAPSGFGLSLAPEVWNFLFLDSLSVIEDGYERKKDAREIQCTVVEQALLETAAKQPEILHSFTPRGFEYYVASLLTNLGFSNVQLTRFWSDGGRDIWATYLEGDEKHVVVVEVKHLAKRKVGLEVVDRLNGVREREGASKGMVVTNSAFTSVAQRRYKALRDRIALVDFERLVGLLRDSGTWVSTPSGLWTPAWHSGKSKKLEVPSSTG